MPLHVHFLFQSVLEHLQVYQYNVSRKEDKQVMRSLLKCILKISKNHYQLRHFHPSVCKEQLGFHWMDFHEISYLSIFPKPVEKIKVSLNLARITATSHEDRYTFLVTSRSVRLRMRNVSEKKNCRENRNRNLTLKIPPTPPKIVPFMR